MIADECCRCLRMSRRKAPFELDQLVQNPYQLDRQLERDIEEWETSNQSYAEYELHCISQGIDKKLVEKLRKDQSSVLDSLDPALDQHPQYSIRTLGEIRLRILELRGVLGAGVTENGGTDLDLDYFEDEESDLQYTAIGKIIYNSSNAESTHNGMSPMTALMSEKWTQRLNKVFE